MVVRKFDFKILLKISLAHSRIPVTFLTPWSMLYLNNVIVIITRRSSALSWYCWLELKVTPYISELHMVLLNHTDKRLYLKLDF